MAAVLAFGDGTVLSHRSAAELWTLLPRRSGPIDVTVPAAAGAVGVNGFACTAPSY